MSTTATVQAVKSSLNSARIHTFEIATVTVGDRSSAALELYAWNARVSGALWVPLHICEVVIRNAASDAISAVYGDRWPWSSVFEQSLPAPPRDYSPRRDLQSSRIRATTTGKVIPELKFVFWQRMFTSRHDVRLWDIHLNRVLPNLDAIKPVSQLRQGIYDDIEQIRGLRNRIAHHEPIFRRDLSEDFKTITRLVHFRCSATATWMMSHQEASKLLQERSYM